MKEIAQIRVGGEGGANQRMSKGNTNGGSDKILPEEHIYGIHPKCNLFCEERGKTEKKKLKERKEAPTGGDRDLVVTRA